MTHNELEELFKKIMDTPDGKTLGIMPSKKLKTEIKALEQLSTMLATIGIGDLVKLYTNKKNQRGR